ncbi:MAG: EAL domain-containing protein [Alphaproteobacteria bacterium]|nr:EAL domain-containing protein [Alphaproteobacteria bacterium]
MASQKALFQGRLFVGHGFWRFDLATRSLVWWDCQTSDGQGSVFDARDQSAIGEALHPEDRPRFEALIRQAATAGGDYTQSFRMRGPSGEWRVISNHATAQRDTSGRISHITGLVVDITEIEICRTLSEKGHDIITQTEPDGTITYISPSVERVLGYRPEDVIGHKAEKFIPPDALEALRAAAREASPGAAAPPRPVQYRMTHREGRGVWLESQLIPLFDPTTGVRVGCTDVARDITAAKEADLSVVHAHSVLRTLMESSPNGILMLDQDHKIASYNAAFAQMWDVPRQVLESGDAGRVLQAASVQFEDPDALRLRVDEVLARRDEAAWDQIETRDGRWIERYSAPVQGPDTAYLGRAWFFRDVTDHKRSLAAAVRAAHFDALTGLANRQVLLDALERAVATARRGGPCAALLHLDVDGLKDINDTRGHVAGDQLLIGLSERLRELAAPTWTLARLGSDEFAILVPELSGPEAASVLAHQVLAHLAAPYSLDESQVYASACVGVEFIDADATDAASVLSHADMAQHQAKLAGPGACRFFTQTMKTEVRQRVSLAAELREAIATGQLFLLYQPAVSITGDRIVGMEALVRWRHPKRGVISPDVFIPVAEKMGLIRDLGRWVLAEAARQMRAWEEAGLPKIRMGVNVSALQFKSPEILETDIYDALAAADLPPWRLELELTESAMMTASEGELLSRLHRAGVRIAIDDFGTGYSSLDYLRRLPAQRVKIAQTFVRHMDTSPGDAAIVKATIGLARDLGLSVIAEGVETEGQLRRLTEWGCGECQGYLFDRPLSADDAAHRLRLGRYAVRGEARAA